ncbi:hypothetical protein PUNSTDRAFT_138086 [Punctularia strigosozonata HHB-11173 SS5]|uniref:Uncharacterized protein n=1 Tax=Punctularia strigosozonata (strain HHB-11173) TaxID=741275 RepID=R7S4Y5_PUNST|nr:uncharacterized protein PUNSTDRAFT_138086 [Punctularia strigosozonata HHB-11173 SS5]EIN04887.1 hypothetical protein PUNSTDRAFT_138086 [Punctularia strigosozonata HHB-11173 SS5]
MPDDDEPPISMNIIPWNLISHLSTLLDKEREDYTAQRSIGYIAASARIQSARVRRHVLQNSEKMPQPEEETGPPGKPESPKEPEMPRAQQSMLNRFKKRMHTQTRSEPQPGYAGPPKTLVQSKD